MQLISPCCAKYLLTQLNFPSSFSTQNLSDKGKMVERMLRNNKAKKYVLITYFILLFIYIYIPQLLLLGLFILLVTLAADLVKENKKDYPPENKQTRMLWHSLVRSQRKKKK
jgi:hypothetical protein